MREIKFRAWDNEEKEMLELVTVGCTRKDSWGPLYIKDKIINGFDHRNYDIMQYTGLKDQNGVDVFEGDIVRYTWDLPDDVNATEKGKKIRVGKVFWSDWRASFAVGKKSVNRDLFRYVRNGNTVEVIGNIYENSDLLEVAE